MPEINVAGFDTAFDFNNSQFEGITSGYAYVFNQKQFINEEGVLVMASNWQPGSAAFAGNFYERTTWALDPDTGRIAVNSFSKDGGNPLLATVNSRGKQASTYTLALFTEQGSYVAPLFSKIQVTSTPTDTTWETLSLYSTGETPYLPFPYTTFADLYAILAQYTSLALKAAVGILGITSLSYPPSSANFPIALAANDPILNDIEDVMVATVQPNAGVDVSAAMATAFTTFIASGKKRLSFKTGEYICNNVAVPTMANRVIDGNEAVIKVTTAGATGLAFTGFSKSLLQNLRFVGNRVNGTGATNTQKGCSFTLINKSRVRGATVSNLSTGIDLVSNATILTNGGVATIPVASFVENCTIDDCYKGIVANPGAEYFSVINNSVYGCDLSGIEVRAGNVAVNNNTCIDNRTGIYYDSLGVGNGDHGMICNNTVNHNRACGIQIMRLAYSMLISGNNVWATFGENLGSDALANSFGVVFIDVINVNFTGNIIARNKVNIAMDGHCNSLYTDNTLLSDPTLTEAHIKEIGFANTTFGLNAINTITQNHFIGDLIGGANPIQLLQTNKTVATFLKSNFGTAVPKFYALAGASPSTFFIDGRHETLFINSTYSGAITVLMATQQIGFDMSMVGTGTKDVTFPGPSDLNIVDYTGGAVTNLGAGVYRFAIPNNYRFMPDQAQGFAIIKL